MMQGMYDKCNILYLHIIYNICIQYTIYGQTKAIKKNSYSNANSDLKGSTWKSTSFQNEHESPTCLT
jgi:hypothetical protein